MGNQVCGLGAPIEQRARLEKVPASRLHFEASLALHQLPRLILELHQAVPGNTLAGT